MNICKELRCPHAYKTGCNQFSVSNHCPVAYLEKGMPDRDISANQYWLSTDNANIDINKLRNRLTTKVLNTECSRRRLDAETRLREMIWDGYHA